MIHNSQATKETRKSDHSAVQSISLPKGGGAIRGIGEKFAANQVTGTGSMSVPIATSPGRSGFGPQLNLTYNSGTGNSPFGFGWNLSIPSISRKTDKGLPQYNDAAESDVFILSGAEDLVPILGRQEERGVPESPADRTVGTVIYDVKGYRPRIEGLFARIERWTNQDDPKDVFWRSISTDNITTWYGKDINSRITDPSDPARIFSWLICESHDDKGNVMVYRYKEENSIGVDHSKANELNRTQESRTANRYLKRIRYGNNKPCYPELRPDKPWHPPTGADDENARGAWHFEIVFDYGEHDLEKPAPAGTGNWKKRNDPFSIYRPGFEVRTMRLCRRVLMFHHFPDEKSAGSDCLVSSTDFTYSHEQDPEHVRNPVYTFLRKVTQSGYKLQEDGSYLKKSLPPLEFEYTRPVVQDEMKTWDTDSPDDLPMGLDVDADSLETCPSAWTARCINGPTCTARAFPAFSPSRATAGSTSATSAPSTRSFSTGNELLSLHLRLLNGLPSSPAWPWPRVPSSWIWPSMACRTWSSWTVPCRACTSTMAMRDGIRSGPLRPGSTGTPATPT